MNFIDFFTKYIWPFLTIAIPVFATIYTAYSRIRNENRENHKPYLNLKTVDTISNIDKYRYFLTLIGRNYLEKYNTSEIKIGENDQEICVNLDFANIGYGVASNIKFYNLFTGEQIIGNQELNNNKNQKLFTTFDIASNDLKQVQLQLVSSLANEKYDHNKILCIYQDLNRNIYSFIVNINIKTSGHYDFYSYQPSSKSYKSTLLKFKKQYKKIIKEYKNF